MKAHYRIEIDGNPLGSWKIYKNGAFFRDRRFYSKKAALRLANSFIEEGREVRIEKYHFVKVLLNGKKAMVWDLIEDTKQVMGI